MRRDVKCSHPEVNETVGVDTGKDKEKSRTLGSSRTKTTQPEDDGSLVLSNNLDTAPDGDGESEKHEDVREEGDDGGTKPIALLDNKIGENN